MPISSQLQRGLFDLIYFTWLHNAEALAYFSGCLFTLFLQFKKPKRIYLLFFIGFLFLLFQFEYTKHIATPLEEQTLQTVLQQGATGARFTKLTRLFLGKVIPLALYIGGWGSVFTGIFMISKTPDKQNHE